MAVAVKESDNGNNGHFAGRLALAAVPTRWLFGYLDWRVTVSVSAELALADATREVDDKQGA